MFTAVTLLHISPAVFGLIAGALAMVFRKGSSLHSIAGTIFSVAMLTMSGSAVWFAVFYKPNMINVMAGLLMFYLVATGWRAARLRGGSASGIDLAAFLFGCLAILTGIALGIQAASSTARAESPAGYFVFASLLLPFVVSDARMLMRGGITGSKRIARHLWRMCLALMFGTLSLYPGQARLFTKAVRDTNLLYIPHVLFAGAAILWMIRIGRRSRSRPAALTVETDEPIAVRRVA